MSFSRRTPAELEPNQLTRLLGEARAAGRRLCDLTVSNPTAVGIAYPLSEIDAALAAVGAGSYTPDPRGLLEARSAVCDYYAGHGRLVDPGEVILTASTSEAYAFLFKLLCDPDDEILVPTPSYPLFDHLAQVEGVVARPYRLAANRGWALEMAAIEAALGERTRAIVLVSPNNPTGSAVGPGDFEELAVLARDRGLALVCDEVFADYWFAEARARPGALLEVGDALGFSLGGLSKAAGMPQLKLGWLVASGPEPLRKEALERLEVIADAFLSVSSVPQRALPELLRIGASVRALIGERVREARAVVERLVATIPRARLLPADGGWYAIVELEGGLDEEEVCLRLLREQDVLVQPGYFFDIDRGSHLVVCLLAQPKDLLHGLTQLGVTLRGGN